MIFVDHLNVTIYRVSKNAPKKSKKRKELVIWVNHFKEHTFENICEHQVRSKLVLTPLGHPQKSPLTPQ